MSLSQNDFFLAMRALLLAISNLYAPETIDTPGQDLNLFLNLVGGACEELSLESALMDLGHYLATVGQVGDEAAERLVSDLTGAQIQRFREKSSVVDVQLSRGSTAAISIPANYPVSTKDGISFRTLAEVSWAADETEEKLVKAECESTGPTGNVDKLTITQISVDGDQTISVINPGPASGGRTVETIPELLARARDWFVNAPRGTLSAIAFGAKQNGKVVTATARELTRPLKPYDNEIPIFRVRVAIADTAGQAGSALVEETRVILQEWRGAGVPVFLVGALVNEVKVQWIGLKAKQNYTLATLQSELLAKMIAFADQLGADIPIELSDLLAIAKGIDGFDGVPKGTLVTPADDVLPPPGYTNRIRAKDVSFA